jgi:hypothetical protein
MEVGGDPRMVTTAVIDFGFQEVPAALGNNPYRSTGTLPFAHSAVP